MVCQGLSFSHTTRVCCIHFGGCFFFCLYFFKSEWPTMNTIKASPPKNDYSTRNWDQICLGCSFQIRAVGSCHFWLSLQSPIPPNKTQWTKRKRHCSHWICCYMLCFLSNRLNWGWGSHPNAKTQTPKKSNST